MYTAEREATKENHQHEEGYVEDAEEIVGVWESVEDLLIHLNNFYRKNPYWKYRIKIKGSRSARIERDPRKMIVDEASKRIKEWKDE